ncbi:RNA-binding protein [bacterium]|nr:RNA-binding protein [bacterium]
MNLYVGNLPFSVNDDELHSAFAAFGTVVSAKVIMDKLTGRSRGFGFVEMGSDDEGRAAINGLNGKSLAGREISVSEARPKAEGAGGGGGYGGGGGRGGYGGGGGGRGGYGGGGGGRSGGGYGDYGGGRGF